MLGCTFPLPGYLKRHHALSFGHVKFQTITTIFLLFRCHLTYLIHLFLLHVIKVLKKQVYKKYHFYSQNQNLQQVLLYYVYI